MRVRVSAVFEREREILCMKYIYGGKEVFALPGGGVDKDIPLQEAITDEWRNEIGVKLDVGEIILIGEAPATKRHPQTLHIIFTALEIKGTPKIRPDSTRSLEHRLGPRGKAAPNPSLSGCGKTALRISEGRLRAVPRVHRELHGKGILVTRGLCTIIPNKRLRERTECYGSIAAGD